MQDKLFVHQSHLPWCPLVIDSRPPFLFMFLTDLTVSSLLSNHLTL